MLFCYDEIIGTYLDNDNFELIIATALTQTPFKIQFLLQTKKS